MGNNYISTLLAEINYGLNVLKNLQLTMDEINADAPHVVGLDSGKAIPILGRIKDSIQNAVLNIESLTNLIKEDTNGKGN